MEHIKKQKKSNSKASLQKNKIENGDSEQKEKIYTFSKNDKKEMITIPVYQNIRREGA